MLKDFLEFLKELGHNIRSSRIIIMCAIYAVMIWMLVSRLYTLQIVNGESYLNNYYQMTEKTVTTPAARGNIYDCNGKLLAYNTLSYSVTIQDNGDYKTNAEKNTMLYTLVHILDSHKETVTGKLAIGLDADGNYVFTVSDENEKKRFLRDFYGLKKVDDLDDAAGKYPSDVSADTLIQSRMDSYKLKTLMDRNGNPVTLTPQETLEIINIRYTMSMTAYQKYETTTVAENIKDETKTDILENKPDILGVDIAENMDRVYNDSIPFASIIGYIGKVQADQVTDLNASGTSDYSLNDLIGRTGIEQSMESELKGTKGSRSMVVDNVGHIMQVTSETQPVAGNDVYLSIDRDLQVGIYHLLEQHLAGVLATKLVNQDTPNDENTDSTERLIPIKDAYYQLINNNVLSLDHMNGSDASSNEKNITSKFNSYVDSSMEQIRSQLYSDQPSNMSDLPEDQQAYMYYMYTWLSSSDVGIIEKDKINLSSDYYTRWKSDSISLREFLYDGIADNWIDTTKLPVGSKYSNADDIFKSLVESTLTSMKSNKAFSKLAYKYLIKNNIVKGYELCIALFDQGILKSDPDEVKRLESSGDEYAYEFFVKQVSQIKITPAQLALDPCTAGCVVTDVKTGKVRALVSYPGYDNNRLSNNMDAAYYNSLLNDQSLPLYNNATQARKAPGSCFKPVTAVAGLEEKVIGLTDTITCTGLYDTITPPMRCWIYPGSHGPLNIIGGIRNSCNFFFGEVGHRLSTDANGNYDTELGMQRIRKYAAMFGLDHKSGVEITETDPLMSDQSPEQSAIGQGTHSYTNVQLSRYVTAIANKGTVFELSVLNKVTDSSGNLIKEFAPNISSKINIQDSTWNAVQTGMREVVEYGSASKLFTDLEVDIAGKTGTAQESKTRANHAFFISFGPYSKPEVAVTVNIPYGYTSSNAASVSKDVYRLCFGYTSLDYILNTGAQNATDVKIAD